MPLSDRFDHLRQVALADARSSLVRCLEQERSAEIEAIEAERAIATETEAATSLLGGDDAVEALATWLPAGRRRAERARAALERLQAVTNRMRAELAACRSALDAVMRLQQDRPDEAAGRDPAVQDNPGLQSMVAPAISTARRG